MIIIIVVVIGVVVIIIFSLQGLNLLFIMLLLLLVLLLILFYHTLSTSSYAVQVHLRGDTGVPEQLFLRRGHHFPGQPGSDQQCHWSASPQTLGPLHGGQPPLLQR